MATTISTGWIRGEPQTTTSPIGAGPSRGRRAGTGAGCCSGTATNTAGSNWGTERPLSRQRALVRSADDLHVLLRLAIGRDAAVSLHRTGAGVVGGQSQ